MFWLPLKACLRPLWQSSLRQCCGFGCCYRMSPLGVAVALKFDVKQKSERSERPLDPAMILLISPVPDFSAPRPQSLHPDDLSCLEVQPQHEWKVTGMVLFSVEPSHRINQLQFFKWLFQTSLAAFGRLPGYHFVVIGLFHSACLLPSSVFCQKVPFRPERAGVAGVGSRQQDSGTKVHIGQMW